MSSVRTSAMAADCCCVGQVTANKLTDDALLAIFEFYLNDNNDPYRIDYLDEWHTLVHVCRRWRDLVVASPRRLNLRLLCSNTRPVREMLDFWPALPIEIHAYSRSLDQNAGCRAGYR
jgi:hypothetical protein